MNWIDVQHLFTHDDGSLPDVFVENLSRKEMVEVYSWVRSLTDVNDQPYVWSVTESKELKVRELSQNPVQLYLDGVVESFRHGLEEFSFSGVRIPQLSIAVEGTSTISFDYRMGVAWGEEQAGAFFKFLAHIKNMAPNSIITRSTVGGSEHREFEFELELQSYVDAS